MDPLTIGWYSWYRIKLRTIQWSQLDSFFKRAKDRRFRYLSSTTELFIQRLAQLTWIGELDLAMDLWEEKKQRYLGFLHSFEEFLFRVILFEDNNPGPVYQYPEFQKVTYFILWEDDAFKFSTIPLSELLNMDRPHFSSADGLVNVDFDKRELVRIAEMVPEIYHEKLRLPFILLEKMPSYYAYMTFGTKLENTVLKNLLKITETPIEKYTETIEKCDLTNISMLGRRKFKTIYKILPELSIVWLSKTYQPP